MAVLADPRDIIEVLSGMSDLLKTLTDGGISIAGIKKFFQKLYKKIVAWIRFTIWVEIAFIIVFLFHCAKPDGGRGTCILAEDSGIDNVKTINMKEFFASGATPNENNYSSGGQRTNWFDTGFITDGKPLIVYASGEYFPWGKKQTERITGYHTGIAKVEDGEFETKVQITDDYQECEFNTDIKFQNDDSEIMRIVYANQLTRYTGQNKNNREGGYSYALAQLGSQSDCIVGNNCFGSNIVKTDGIAQVDYPTGCVLKNGAGIYMRIGGPDVKYAYHIKNTYVPLLEKECLLGDDGLCEWKYKDKTNLGSVNVAQVPFGLPIQIYNQEATNFTIFEDIRSNLIKNLTPITKYQWKEKQLTYKFTTLERVPNKSKSCEKEGLTDTTKYQTLNDVCYQTITKEMTNDELLNHSCQEFSTDLLHPDELCPPPKDKRIWIKPADTFYEDDEGIITLLFASGAKNTNSQKAVSYAKNGFQLSWIQTVLYTIIEPLWGEQLETEPTINLINRENSDSDGTIEICHKKGKTLFYSKYKGNYIIKTAKYATTGMIMQMSDTSQPTVSLYDIFYSSKIEGKKDCLTLKARDANHVPDYHNVNHKMHDGVATWLIQIDNIQDGLFFQIRDNIMKSGHFQMVRIMIAVWFVFSFGIGFLNKKKIITFFGESSILHDWKHFLICMWMTDYKNYALIDEMLWPALFHGAESLATILFEAGSDVFGSSLNPDNPYEYFNNIINMVTSKELIFKLMSIGTNFDGVVFSLFFLYFPMCFLTCVELFKAVMIPISMVCLTVFGVGQVMMLMPVYALASFFKSQKDVLKKTMKQLMQEFVHFALELGFFGIFIGIVYGKFLKSIDIKICWDKQIEYKLFYIFPLTFENWLIKDNHQSLKGMWSLTKTMAGCWGLSFIAQYACQVATMLADKLCKSGGLGLGLRQASVYGNMAGNLLNKAIKISTSIAATAVDLSGTGIKGLLGFGGVGSKAIDDLTQGIKEISGTLREGVPNLQNDIKTIYGLQDTKQNSSDNKSNENKETPSSNKNQDGGAIGRNNEGDKESSSSNKNQDGGAIGRNNEDINSESRAHSAIEDAKKTLGMNIDKKTKNGNHGDILGNNILDPRKRKPARSHNNGINNNMLEQYKKSLEEKQDEKKKQDEEISRGAGMQSGFEGLKTNEDAGLKDNKDAGLKDNKDAGLKNAIAGNEKNNEEELKKQEEKKEKEEAERKAKEEKLKQQQEAIEEIEKQKKLQQEAEEKAKQEAIKKEQENTERLERMKKEAEEQRQREEKERIERAQKEEEEKRQAELAKQKAEEEKAHQEMVMKAAQKLERKPQPAQQQSSRKQSQWGYVQDKWSALSSGKSVWQKRDLKTHYLDSKRVWHKKK